MMGKLLDTWRYYSFGLDEYKECMNKIYTNNLDSLRRANSIYAILAVFFSLFPLLFERNFVDTGVYLATALIAFLLSKYMNYRIQTGEVSNRFIYVFTSIFYINVMTLGIYHGVWASADKPATIFLCLLICALLMFINPPTFNLCLTLGAMGVFIISSVVIKSVENIIYDILDTFIAGVIGLYFTWHITKLRLGLEISTTLLEEERNKYQDQSTIDELTQINNRRDYMQTFKRYLSKYRPSDDWLCIAICDIDYFKNYNDHYGHPMGDDCLRSVGAAFRNLKEDLGVYVARVGGEEFAMLWFGKDISHVDNVISYMTNAIKERKIPHEKSTVSEYVTMSIGVFIEKLGVTDNVEELYNLADQALYAAKGSGRNCAVVTGREIEQYKIAPDA